MTCCCSSKRHVTTVYEATEQICNFLTSSFFRKKY